MRNFAFLLVCFAVLATGTGCSSDGDGPPGTDGSGGGGVGVYSCRAISGHCLEFVGSTYLTSQRRNVERMGCTQNSGTFQETACTATGRIGRCIREQGSAGERVTHYYQGDLATFQASCMREGNTWAAN